MARSIDDLQLLISALSSDFAETKSLMDRRSSLQGCRVAWYSDDEVAPVTEETRETVKAAARVLEEAGLVLEERRPPGVERGHDLWLKLFSRASVVLLRSVYSDGYEDAGGFVRWRLANADKTPLPMLDEYIAAWMERDRLRLALCEWMNTTQLLLAPVGATPALKHDTQKVTVNGRTLSVFRAFSYSQAFNVFDLPSVCVPAGSSSEGLPIGVQIVGRPFAEEDVLLAAAIVERELGGWQPPKLPGF